MYKTLIVCHVGLFEELLRETLRDCPSFTLVGSYADFGSALEGIGASKPAVALVYLTRSCTMEAVAFVHGVRNLSPLTRIAFLYHAWEADAVESLISEVENPRALSFLESGALTGAKELYSALAGVASGLALWDRNLSPHGEEWLPGRDVLSERDVEVLSLLAAGFSNQGIASRLGRSVESVKASICRIYEAFGIDKANNPEKHPRVLAAAIYRARYGSLSRPPAPSPGGTR